ncbi:MAG: PDDEXK nuclease domain-containing protein [Rhabdochlamydiaceae bacterium]|jgi:predicted nuclease of restriction endonuclease-like (RecB) superfamily
MKERKTILSHKQTPAEVIPTGYKVFITDLKGKIRSSQLKASITVNRELIRLYWEIGKDVVERQEQDGWGSKVIERVARDLQNEFPGIEGFSKSNLFRMRAFYKSYTIVAQAVRQLDELPISSIPWGHNIAIFQSIRDIKERLWYANMTIEEGWSRDELIGSIKRHWYKRYGKAITNFVDRLPDPHSRLAQEATKDPYYFDFIELKEAHVEKELEDGLLDHIEKFMLEMGRGFAFIGRQVNFVVNGKDFYVDLLMYNLEANCYYVIELKATDFKPDYVGKMSFYLSAVDAKLKKKNDNPTIGLLICKRKDDFIVEYTLKDIKKPIGVAGYETKIIESLPKQLQGKLPTVAEIEAELNTLTLVDKKKIRQKKKKAKNPR